jgi:hypothetical protein
MNDSNRSPSAAPVPKVAVGGAVGAAVAVLVWILKQYGGIELPAEVAAALTVIFSFAAGYLTPPGGMK